MRSHFTKIIPLAVALMTGAVSLAACADFGHTETTKTTSTTQTDGVVTGQTTTATSSSVAADGTVLASSSSTSTSATTATPSGN